MGAYIQQLKLHAEREEAKAQAQRDEEARLAAQAARERLTPLQTRVERLLETIPIELQREGLSLASLRTSLRGRWRGACHPGELGSVLRKLGFARIRRWDGEADGFRAVWQRQG